MKGDLTAKVNVKLVNSARFEDKNRVNEAWRMGKWKEMSQYVKNTK